jgi:hypothetical protein
MLDMNASTVAEHKALIANAERKIAELAPMAASAADNAQVAKERLDKIKRGENVPGGLGKRFDQADAIAILKAAGWTPRDFRRMKLVGELTDAEFEAALAATHADRPTDKAFEREARRIIRTRG